MPDYSAGTGPDELVLYLTAEEFEGFPHANFGINGQPPLVEYAEITALRGSGETDTVTLRGDWDDFQNVYAVFLDDRWGGSPEDDRNLYIERAEINGVEVEGAARAMFGSFDTVDIWFDGDVAAPEPEPEPGRAVSGTAAADTLTGGTGPDTIQGLAGDDILNGLAGADVLRGGAGSDVIEGGSGDDQIVTSGGRDAVLFSPGDGVDTVTDFAPDLDAVWIGDNAQDTAVRAETRGGDVGSVVYFSEHPGSEVWLPGVDAAELGLVTIVA